MLTEEEREELRKQIWGWKCPQCGYLLAETLYRAARLNFVCPRCERAQLSDYVPVMKPPAQSTATEGAT